MSLDVSFGVNQANGIEVFINAEGNYIFNVAHLKKSAGKLNYKNIFSAAGNFEDLSNTISKGIPASISITGKGIVHKKIARTINDTFETILDKVLPGAKIDEFYVQIFEVNEFVCIASVARRSVVNSIVKEISAIYPKVVSCNLGPFSIQSVLPVIFKTDHSVNDLKVGEYQLQILDNSIVGCQTIGNHDAHNVIGQESFQLKSSELIAYSSAFSVFYPVIQLRSNISEIADKLSDFENEVRFKKLGIIVIACSLVVLIVNFILLSYFTNCLSKKSNALLSDKEVLKKFEYTKTQIADRKFFLERNGLAEPSRTSFYTDQIAANLPAGIVLSGINIHPIQKSEDKNILKFESNQILVYGRSTDAIDLNTWIKLLKGKDWVKDISLVNYNKKETSNESVFEIKMILK